VTQFDEESARAARSPSPRARPGPPQALLAVEEIDDAVVRVQKKTYGACERCHEPIPNPPARAALRPPLRGVQERGPLASLSQGPPRTARISAGLRARAHGCCRGPRRRRRGGRGRPVTKALALEHLGPGRTTCRPFGFALGYNTGSAFSLFTGHAVWLGLLVVVSWRCWPPWRGGPAPLLPSPSAS